MGFTVYPQIPSDVEERILFAFLRMSQKKKALAMYDLVLIRLNIPIKPINELTWYMVNYEQSSMDLGKLPAATN